MVEIGDVEHGVDILKTVLLESSKQKAEEDDPAASSGLQFSPSILDPENLLLVLNKVDLKETNAKTGITAVVDSPTSKTFQVSCHTNEGIDSFLSALTETVTARVNGGPDGKDSAVNRSEGSLITRARHRQHVQAAVEALERFDVLSQQGTMVVDMAAEELRLAASELGRVTGAVDVEDILDVLFKDFCIGK
jgi:tRNA modification GTPase